VLAFERSRPAVASNEEGLGVDRAKLDALGSQPAGEVEEVEGVGRTVAANNGDRQIGEVSLHSSKSSSSPLAGDLPSSRGFCSLAVRFHGT